MSQTLESLWPQELAVANVITPVVILREQAAALGKLTKNVLEGEVVSATDDEQNVNAATAVLFRGRGLSSVERQVRERQQEPVFYHSFYIKAPALGNYRYKLFYVHHHTVLYPATIVADEKQDSAGSKGLFQCKNEEEFKAALTSIFASDETKRIVSALLTQSTG